MENKTVVTKPMKGAKQNKWLPILEKYNVDFVPLTDVEWVDYKPNAKMLAMNKVLNVRHHSNKHIHKVLVDLLTIQRLCTFSIDMAGIMFFGGTPHTTTEYNFPNPHPAHIHPNTDTHGRGQESYS
ncbi:MAG: hypothetical protein IBX40_12235 [Methanosarcinales archaeon]|nr:hypothetical protein [Methanosarcinales archaeon]